MSVYEAKQLLTESRQAKDRAHAEAIGHAAHVRRCIVDHAAPPAIQWLVLVAAPGRLPGTGKAADPLLGAPTDVDEGPVCVGLLAAGRAKYFSHL